LKSIFQPWLKDNKLSLNLFSKSVHFMLKVYIQDRIKQVPIITISNETLIGIERLKGSIIKGKSYCLLGSSGVGKSTLVNNLSGKQLLKTNTISPSTNRGRHVTTHRELLVLENGGILIDNPGMREVGDCRFSRWVRNYI